MRDLKRIEEKIERIVYTEQFYATVWIARFKGKIITNGRTSFSSKNSCSAMVTRFLKNLDYDKTVKEELIKAGLITFELVEFEKEDLDEAEMLQKFINEKLEELSQTSGKES